MPFYTQGAYEAMLRLYLAIITDAFDMMLELNVKYGIGFCPRHKKWENFR